MMLLGAAMTKTTQLELMMTANDKLAKKSFYCAESGITVATADMQNILESEGQWDTPTAGWVGNYEDEDYGVSIVDFDFEATFKEDGLGNVIRWGDPDENYIFEENIVVGAPIVRITSNGRSGHPKRQGISAIQVEIYSRSIVIDPDAALYVGGNLENNGGSQTADGEYNMCVGGGTKDIITTPTADPNYQATDWTGGCGASCDLDNTGSEYPIDDVALNLVQIGTEIVSDNNLILGDMIDNKGVYYHLGSINVMNNLEGYGILVIIGDLTLGGNISWNGLIIVTGNSTFNGGGSKQIYGSVITGGDVLGNGSPDFLYDCDIINDLEDNYTSYTKRWWRQT
jgi:hypothetical protein